jgi:dihydroxy-acid dehydratase
MPSALLAGRLAARTNAVIHLDCHCRSLGRTLDALMTLTGFGRDMPACLNLQPSGDDLMEDFCYAGGLPVGDEEW